MEQVTLGNTNTVIINERGYLLPSQGEVGTIASLSHKVGKKDLMV